MRRAVVVLAGIVALGVGALVLVREPPDFVERVRYPLRYEAIVRGHARNYRLDPALLAAVIYAESRFRPDARSEAGAVGLMQLLPDTARGIALRTGGQAFVSDDLTVPELNVRYGAWYLRHMIDRYGNERTGLAAYHAGPGNVDAWRGAGGGIRFEETRRYVDDVLAAKRVYADIYADELGLP